MRNLKAEIKTDSIGVLDLKCDGCPLKEHVEAVESSGVTLLEHRHTLPPRCGTGAVNRRGETVLLKRCAHLRSFTTAAASAATVTCSAKAHARRQRQLAAVA